MRSWLACQCGLSTLSQRTCSLRRKRYAAAVSAQLVQALGMLAEGFCPSRSASSTARRFRRGSPSSIVLNSSASPTAVSLCTHPGSLQFRSQGLVCNGMPLMRCFHRPDDEKRMVVILEPHQFDDWLYVPVEQIWAFLQTFPAEKLVAQPAVGDRLATLL